MAEQEVLVTLDNLEYYQEELIKKLPKDQVWYGNMEPSYGLPDEYILAVNYQAGKVYYRLANKKWKLISSGSVEEGGTINSRVNVSRVSQKDLYISPDDGKCNISFKWTCSISGKQVNTPGNITIVVNGSEREKFKIEPGTVTKDVRQYLKDGSNTVMFNIVDGYGTPNSIDFKVEVVKLVVSVPGYKQNSLIYLSELNGGNFKINVTAAGGTPKDLHIIIHATEEEKKNGIKDVEQIVEYGSSTVTKTVQISPMDLQNWSDETKTVHGSRLIEFYASHTFDATGKTIYSNSVFYDTIWIDDIKSNPDAIIASQFNITEGKQYELFNIPFFIYKMGKSSCLVRLTTISKIKNEETGEIQEEKVVIDPQLRETEIPLEWVTSGKFSGEHIFIIEAGSLVDQKFVPEDKKEFKINLSQQSQSPITRPEKMLYVEFVAEQTDSNNIENRTSWPYFYEDDNAEKNLLKPTFTDFDWTNNGWELRDERAALKISKGAQLEIPYKIFGSQGAESLLYFPDQGGTIEIDVSFDEITDSELDFFTCYDEDKKKGIKISPSRALMSNGEKTVEVRYANSESKKYNNSMKFSFIISKRKDRITPEGEIKANDKVGSMFIYINGVGASASDYVATEFGHSSTCTFSSEGCSVHLHSFRVYREDFTSKDVLQNWISDMNVGDQINAYNENWFYDSNGEITYNGVLSKIPCLTIYGKMPTYKSDKKYVSMKFEGAGIYDFTIPEVEIDVQGTSSQYYPVKNWKFKSKYKKKVEQEDGSMKEETITSSFNMTQTGEEVDSYPLGDDQLPAKVFCLKADYMETSSTHNTVTANLVHTMYDEKTPPQKILPLKEGQTLQEEKERAEKTRTTIYGRPIAVFYVENPDDPNAIPVFGGKYNFNYDKGAEHVFGFFEDDRFEVIDCVEFRSNDNDMCQLILSDYETPKETTDKAILKEYDKNSWIKDQYGTVTGAYIWGNAFEFRYLYHKNKKLPPHAYLQAVTDWVVERDCKRKTGEKLPVPIKRENGVAKFLYDEDSAIIKFYQEVEKDGEIITRTRRALNPEYSDKDSFDFAVEEVTGYTFDEHNNKIPCTYLCLAWDDEYNKEMYIFDRDTENYRLTIFKNEFEEHFNVHYCLMYFLLMELLGMIDSGAKNMFWATWGERHKNHQEKDENGEYKDQTVIWYPIFYDMDSILGLNNVGLMNIPYNMDFNSTFSDTGSNGGFIYNSGRSRFWENFRRAYQTELNNLFDEKVKDNTFNLSKILKMYEDHSESFSASMYNEDGQLKIINQYLQGYYEATPEELEILKSQNKQDDVLVYPNWMYVYQGDRYYYRRYWLPNRFNYMLSKNFSGSYAKSFISMRLWDPRTDEKNEDKDIDVNYAFDVETWKDQFVTIKYGSTAVSRKCNAGKIYRINAPNTTYNDSETGIFGASNIKSIGKVSNKYATTIDLSRATQLIEADLGSNIPDYDNLGFNTINFGSNSMLRRVNIENCKGLTSNIELSNCKNIIEINAKGSCIAGVNLSQDGGPLETLLLPDTTTTLILRNYPKMKKYGTEEVTEKKEIDVDGEMITEEKTYLKDFGFLLPQKKKLDENGEKTDEDDGYNITTLVVENTPNVNTREIVQDRIEQLDNLSLTKMDWTYKIKDDLTEEDNSLDNGDLLLRIIQRAQIEDESLRLGGYSQKKPKLEGDCHVKNIKDYLVDKINTYFNDGPVEKCENYETDEKFLKRKFRLRPLNAPIKTRKARFFDASGNQIENTGNDDDRVEVNKTIKFELDYPQKDPEWDYNYVFIGWEERSTGNTYTTFENGRVVMGTMPDIEGENDEGLIFYPIYEKSYIPFTFIFNSDHLEKEQERTIVLTTLQNSISPKESPNSLDYSKKAYETDPYNTLTYFFTKWNNTTLGSDYDIQKGGKIEIPKVKDSEGNYRRVFMYSADYISKNIHRVRFYDRVLDKDGNKILLHVEGQDYDEWGDIYYEGNEIKIPEIDFYHYDYDNDYYLEQWTNITNGKYILYSKNPEQPYDTIQVSTEFFGAGNYMLEFEPTYSSKSINYTINFHCIEGGPKNTSLTYPDKNIKTINCNWNQAVNSPSMDSKDWDSEHEEFGYDLIGWRLREQKKEELTTQNPVDLINLNDWHTHCENKQLNKPDARVLDYYIAYKPHYFDITFEYYATADKKLQGTLKTKTENRHYLYELSNPLTKSEKKYSTIDKHYTFSDWNPSLQLVTENATYQAKYSYEDRTYTVTFVHQDNENQILDGPKQIKYGESPTYGGTTPTKKDDGGGTYAQYQYTFNGWKKKGSTANASKDLNTFIIKEDTILIATFKRETKEYDITWVNKPSGLLDGESAVSINQTKADKVKYGVKPAYNYNEPKITVPNNSQWYYQFIGWQKGSDGVIFKNPNDPNNPSTGTEGGIQLVDGPAKYGAVFQQNWASYDIKFIDHDEKILPVVDENGNEYDEFSYKWGTSLTTNKIPQGPYAEGHRTGYTFVGWTGQVSGKLYEVGKELPEVKYKETYQATYTPNYYQVTFVNSENENQGKLLSRKFVYDEPIIYSDTQQPDDKPIPSKIRNYKKYYEFSGWKRQDENGNWIFYNKNDELLVLPQPTIYYATFEEKIRTYDIKFYDINLGTQAGEKAWDIEKITYQQITKSGWAPKAVAGGTQIPSPLKTEETEKIGYKLLGWKTDPNQEGYEVELPIIDSSWNELEGKSFYLAYEPIFYSIEFYYLKNPENKTVSKSNILSYNSEKYIKYHKEWANYGYTPNSNDVPKEAGDNIQSTEERLGFLDWNFGSKTSSTTGFQQVTGDQIYYASYYKIGNQYYTAYWYAGPNVKHTAQIEYTEKYDSVNGKAPPWYSAGKRTSYGTNNIVITNAPTMSSSEGTITGDKIFRATAYYLKTATYTWSETSDTKKGPYYTNAPDWFDDTNYNGFNVKIGYTDDFIPTKKFNYCMVGLDIKDGGKLKDRIYRVEVDFNAKMSDKYNIGVTCQALLAIKDSTITGKEDLSTLTRASTSIRTATGNGSSFYLDLDPAYMTLASLGSLRKTNRIYFGYYESGAVAEYRATFSNVLFTIHYREANPIPYQ